MLWIPSKSGLFAGLFAQPYPAACAVLNEGYGAGVSFPHHQRQVQSP
jgi:hypothetical protein